MPKPFPIERAFFRKTEDGASVFFPWGLTRRGYRLPDETAREKAARGASLLLSATMAIGTVAAYLLEGHLKSGAHGPAAFLRILAAPGAALLLMFVIYGLWASRFVEGYAESDLQVSREERLREAAELADTRKVALIGIVLCGLSALLIWLQPDAWWLGLLGILLGIGILFWSHVLRRAAATPS